MQDQPHTTNVHEQIETYITSQPEPKQSDMRTLHRLILDVMPGCELWFLDGKDSAGRVVSNPNIGYGRRSRTYADGKSKDFYQIGVSANKSGISVYILGLPEKKYLAETYGTTIGKASVTGYCISFKALKHINVDVLEAAIRDGVALTAETPAGSSGEVPSAVRAGPASSSHTDFPSLRARSDDRQDESSPYE